MPFCDKCGRSLEVRFYRDKKYWFCNVCSRAFPEYMVVDEKC